jgi:hypothetical protein
MEVEGTRLLWRKETENIVLLAKSLNAIEIFL